MRAKGGGVPLLAPGEPGGHAKRCGDVYQAAHLPLGRDRDRLHRDLRAVLRRLRHLEPDVLPFGRRRVDVLEPGVMLDHDRIVSPQDVSLADRTSGVAEALPGADAVVWSVGFVFLLGCGITASMSRIRRAASTAAAAGCPENERRRGVASVLLQRLMRGADRLGASPRIAFE